MSDAIATARKLMSAPSKYLQDQLPTIVRISATKQEEERKSFLENGCGRQWRFQRFLFEEIAAVSERMITGQSCSSKRAKAPTRSKGVPLHLRFDWEVRHLRYLSERYQSLLACLLGSLLQQLPSQQGSRSGSVQYEDPNFRFFVHRSLKGEMGEVSGDTASNDSIEIQFTVF
jgi:hypothetical protein